MVVICFVRRLVDSQDSRAKDKQAELPQLSVALTRVERLGHGDGEDFVDDQHDLKPPADWLVLEQQPALRTTRSSEKCM